MKFATTQAKSTCVDSDKIKAFQPTLGQYSSVQATAWTGVGWVEERNPTFSWLCWVTLSLHPTYYSLNSDKIKAFQPTLGQYSSVQATAWTGVGWVEERNPTFSWLCWVTLSLHPTLYLNCVGRVPRLPQWRAICHCPVRVSGKNVLWYELITPDAHHQQLV
ncbi:hypothetical protein [Nostoc sp. FACHB-110]|uniref:hypothetical protein n=1 Tax=Nostoc sp. FACHB-110 TaxID=2692834 RepID=UPI0016868C68|nr:hypothetical protein [Nostoc sp. FACHB-110]MBD2436610.1 hypothetical protein [Nostoc sp. FACHB-110]